jgi:hypothetical protein
MLEGTNPMNPYDYSQYKKRPTEGWPAPTGERFIPIFGGPLDGDFLHADGGWYYVDVNAGLPRYVEWVEPDVNLGL